MIFATRSVVKLKQLHLPIPNSLYPKEHYFAKQYFALELRSDSTKYLTSNFNYFLTTL